MRFNKLNLLLFSGLVLCGSMSLEANAQVYIKKNNNNTVSSKPKVYVPQYNPYASSSSTSSSNAIRHNLNQQKQFVDQQVEAYNDWKKSAQPRDTVEKMVAFAQSETSVGQKNMLERREKLIKQLEGTVGKSAAADKFLRPATRPEITTLEAEKQLADQEREALQKHDNIYVPADEQRLYDESQSEKERLEDEQRRRQEADDLERERLREESDRENEAERERQREQFERDQEDYDRRIEELEFDRAPQSEIDRLERERDEQRRQQDNIETERDRYDREQEEFTRDIERNGDQSEVDRIIEEEMERNLREEELLR